MAREFIEFSSGYSPMTQREFIDAVQRIWDKLLHVAKGEKDMVLAFPDDDALAEKAMNSARELLAFGVLMQVGDDITLMAIKKMRDDAKNTPDDPMSQKIIALTDKLLEINEEKYGGSSGGTGDKN